MSSKMSFEYYYGVEAEQFSFFRVPKLLFTDERFNVMSNDSKLAYGLMLDRMSLSIKNGWVDEENRAYIIYTIEDIMEDLGCSKGKAVKLLAELDSKSGIGLIEKHNRGLGLPAIIYVKNFAASVDNFQDYEQENEPENDEKEPANPLNSTEVQKLNFKKSKNRTSRSSKIEPLEVQKSNFKESKNRTSGGTKNEPLEVQKLDPNNTNNNKTKKNKTELNDTELNKDIGMDRNQSIYLSALQPLSTEESYLPPAEYIDTRSDEEYYRDTIAKNMRVDLLKARALESKDVAKQKRSMKMVDETYEIICDMVCYPRKTVHIRGVYYPWENVKVKFLNLDQLAISGVIDRVLEGDLKIKQIKPYLISALFEASMSATLESEVAVKRLEHNIRMMAYK